MPGEIGSWIHGEGRTASAAISKKRAQAKVCALFCGEQRLDSHVVEPLRELYRRKLGELVDLQLRIERAIESLTSTEREMMRLRYIDGADWTEVATEIHYKWTQTHRIHARALGKIKDV